MQRTISWIKYLFGGIGIFMLVIAVMMTIATRSFVKRAVRVPGVITELIPVSSDDGGQTWKPSVRFRGLDGVDYAYTESFSQNPAPYAVGETVQVLYLRDDPDDARIDSFSSLWAAQVILGVLGTVFTAVGGGIILAQRMARRRKAWMEAYGTAVQTEFQRVELNESLEVNGRHPWRIVSQWLNPATGKLHVFNSENLWFDPTKFVAGKHVTVLYDPADPRRYHMDVSFLPQLAE